MAKHSKYQQQVIRNYYQNREAISLQRLEELVTELYLAEGKSREKHWKRLVTHLEKLGVKQDQIDRLVNQNDPAAVAAFVKKLLQQT